MDVKGLLNTRNGGSPESESPLRWVFSSNMVERIAAETLTKRYASGEPPLPRATHMAAAKSISLGMTLTNLNGVDYGYDIQPNAKFIFTRHEHQLTRETSVGVSDHEEIWDVLRDASVASAAY